MISLDKKGEGLHPQARGHLTTLAHFLISLGLGILAGIEHLDEAQRRGHHRKATRFSRALCSIMKQGVLAELLSLIVALATWSPLPRRSEESKRLLGSLDVLAGGLDRWSQRKERKGVVRPLIATPPTVSLNGTVNGVNGTARNGHRVAAKVACNGHVPLRFVNVDAVVDRLQLGMKPPTSGYRRNYFAALRCAAISVLHGF